MTTSAPPQTSDAALASGPRSALVLYGARGARGFGDGFVIILIPAYLSALGYGAADIGILASVSLLGTAVCTLAVGFIAPRHDLRRLLLGGALLMALSGFAFPNADNNFIILMVVMFVGTMNPSTGDLGVLVPLEHAMLARSAADEERTRTFARYSLIGALSMAAGALAAAAPELLVHLGIGTIAAFKVMFYAYAALGLASAALYRLLPHARISERTSAPLGPSRGTVYKLAALFSLDAFAGGFAVQSLVALWLFQRFDLSLSAASLFFFWTSVLSAFSYPVAAWLSRRIGLVNTMVFTHIPSSVFLILAALSPNLVLTLLLLLARAALSQMDVPTRTSYVMAVVTPPERTAAASVTAVPRSLASSVSPALAGALLTGAFSGLPLVICGALKIVYDVSLLLSFRHIKPPEEGP
jgi:MFS family permease